MDNTILKYNIDVKRRVPFKPILITISILLGLILISILISPLAAYADYPWGILDGGLFEAPKNFMANLGGNFISTINDSFVKMCNTIKNIDTSLLTADWTHLLGSDSIYNWITAITNTVIKPIAATILSVVLLMQMLKITSKADSQGTMPVVKEVIFLIIFMAVFIYIIANCDHICCAIYEAVLSICKGITATGKSMPNPTSDFISANWGDKDQLAGLDLGKLIPFWLVFLLGELVAFIAGIVTTVMIIARGLQLYVYSTFSPIPMSLLGFEETRSWGVGYFKSFAAVALSGAFILIIIFAMPYVMVAIMGGASIEQSVMTVDAFSKSGSTVDGLKYAGYAISVLIVCIMGVVKSGSWAKELLGS